MILLVDSWRLSVGTLTAIPVRPPTAVDPRQAAVAMVLAPVAVLPLGLAVAGVLLVGHWLDLPSLVSALLALGALVVGNRAFHLDGLADTVDGLAASYDPARSLEVMKTGTCGPAGVVALVLVLGLQAAGLASLASSMGSALLAGVAVCASRAALVLCCARGVPAARAGGLGLTYTGTVPRVVAVLVWLALTAALAAGAAGAGLEWWRGVLAAGVAVVVVLALILRVTRRLGGVTGDVFGAAIELSLASILVVLS